LARRADQSGQKASCGQADQGRLVGRGPDLKPSNILGTEVDGKPIPRIIDFGIAKAASQTSADAETLLTGVGSLVGTPDYMSPEQADRSNADIDTRTMRGSSRIALMRSTTVACCDLYPTLWPPPSKL
jgi:serine/threonine protein kinase